MRKALYILIAAMLMTACSDTGRGLGFNRNKGKANWTNGIVRFSANMDSKGQDKDNPAFDAYVKYQDGHTIHMPVDVYGLGYGASCPMGNSGLYKPDQGFESAEILAKTDEKIVVHLHHKSWTVIGARVSFDKQVTLFRDSPIMSVIDYYTGQFELLNVAAGMTTAMVATVEPIDNGYILNYPYGVTGIIVMPGLEQKFHDEILHNVILKKSVTRDEPLRYYVGLSDKGKEFLLDEIDKIL